MMKRKLAFTFSFALLINLSLFSQTLAQETGTNVVQAILFYQPTCPHCHEVIETHLPPLKEKYGDRFQLIGVDTSLQAGAELYQGAVASLNLPSDRLGVPLLVVGDVALIGSQEIPQELPGIIENGLANGGIGWPDIPGLYEVFPDLRPSMTALSDVDQGGVEASGPGDVLPLNSDSLSTEPTLGLPDSLIGWATISFTVIVLIYSVLVVLRAARNGQLQMLSPVRMTAWPIPFLAAVGLVISSYLAYVELTQTAAVCGLVGECNIVQSSDYARLAGIPIAVYGIFFYVSILGLWLFLRYRKKESAGWIAAALTILSFFGTLFSIYLTALELLVIKAVCAWCLTSAVISTLLLLLCVTLWLKQGSSDIQSPKVASQTG